MNTFSYDVFFYWLVIFSFNTQTHTEPGFTKNSPHPCSSIVTSLSYFLSQSTNTFPANFFPISIFLKPSLLLEISTAQPESGWSFAPSLVHPIQVGKSK